MKENVNVEGEIDAAFTSTTVPKQTTEDENGNTRFDHWPSDLDASELTEKQRTVLKLAFQNPAQSAGAIDEQIGSNQYANKILREKVPEWYDNVFKKRGNSKAGRPAGKTTDKESDDTDETATETVVSNPSDVEGVISILKRTAVHEETVNALEVVEERL
jgi:hypothetical protein